MIVIFIVANLIISRFWLADAQTTGKGKEFGKSYFLRKSGLQGSGKYPPTLLSSFESPVFATNRSIDKRKSIWALNKQSTARKASHYSQHDSRHPPVLDFDKYLEVLGPGLFQIPLILALIPFALPALPLMVWAEEHYEGHHAGGSPNNSNLHSNSSSNSNLHSNSSSNSSEKARVQRKSSKYLRFETK